MFFNIFRYDIFLISFLYHNDIVFLNICVNNNSYETIRKRFKLRKFNPNYKIRTI